MSIRETRPGQKIIFANGVFDLLHPGHVKLLEYAKSLGDYLVVGLNSDRSTKGLKGETRPIQTQNVRKKQLESLPCVDEVVIFNELRTTDIIRSIDPHVVVKGNEYEIELIRSTDLIPDHIDIVRCPILTDELGKKISTTAIIASMSK